MGPKITIDSATMMNKGLEVVEARWLFDMKPPQVEVVIHPQSVVHSLVAYVDGSVLAQLGPPDMRTPIAYTLGWPTRIAAPTSRLNLAEIGQLTFEAPDPERFPALRLAYEVIAKGGTALTVFNAANEAAVAAFLREEIRFQEIIAVVERTLNLHIPVTDPTLEEILEADAWARRETEAQLAGRSRQPSGRT